MLKHLDYCTHLKFGGTDRDILTRVLFNVNIRLFKSSEPYRSIILSTCNYLRWLVSSEREGYTKPLGFSGANAGIPFNIIALVRYGTAVVMINPKITARYGRDIQTLSSCDSLILPDKISVIRDEYIDITYYDEKGKQIIEKRVDRMRGGFTIQHGIDHNLGILITALHDAQAKLNGDV